MTVRVAINGYGVIGKRVADAAFYAYMVDNQAIVVPETIDAIRALTRAEADGKASIAKTDAAMGIGSLFH